MNKSIKKKAVTILVIIAFVFLFSKIYQEKEIFTNFNWRFDITSFVIMVVLLLLNYLSNIVAWHIILKSLHQKISFFEDFRIWALSSLTRFIPGKIWQYPGRIIMLSEAGVSTIVSGTAILAEILFNLTFGALVVLGSQIDTNYRLFYLVFILPFIFLLLTNRFFLKRLIVLVKWLSGKNLKTLEQINFSYKYIPLIIISFVVRFVVPGGVLYFLIDALTPVNINLLPVFIGLFSLSWLIGYVSIFAPAGLGVAEITLAGLLSSYMPLSVASSVAVGFRIVNLLAEAILVVFIFFYNSRHRFNIKKIFTSLF